jgi:hypothetical protein
VRVRRIYSITHAFCIWSVAFYGLETWSLGKNEERVINAFETRCWRRMLKIKRTDGITNEQVYQRAKKEYYF